MGADPVRVRPEAGGHLLQIKGDQALVFLPGSGVATKPFAAGVDVSGQDGEEPADPAGWVQQGADAAIFRLVIVHQEGGCSRRTLPATVM